MTPSLTLHPALPSPPPAIRAKSWLKYMGGSRFEPLPGPFWVDAYPTKKFRLIECIDVNNVSVM